MLRSRLKDCRCLECNDLYCAYSSSSRFIAGDEKKRCALHRSIDKALAETVDLEEGF